MPWDVTTDPARFDEAADWFKARVPIPAEAWRQLEQEAREKAFTISEVANLGLVEDVWTALERAVEDGTTLEDFRKEVGDDLEAAWGGSDPWRLETIFRTNVQQAYGAGRFAQMTDPAILERRPWWRFSAIMDSRTSLYCRPKHGTVKRADDPWWRENYPPLHFCCRSDVMALTADEAKGYGGETAGAAGPASQGGFGRTPALGDWAGAWAKNVVADKGTPWKPLAGLPTAEVLGRPEIEALARPGELLPRQEDVGVEEFRRLLRKAWGGDTVTVADPTGSHVILSADVLAGHVAGKPEGRERFLGLLPEMVRSPAEIWLVPGRRTARGPIELRKHYLASYRDEKGRYLWLAGAWRKGGWYGWTVIPSSELAKFQKKRIGYLFWPKKGLPG